MAKDTENKDLENKGAVANKGTNEVKKGNSKYDEEVALLNAMIQNEEEVSDNTDYRDYEISVVYSGYDLKDDGMQLQCITKDLNGQLEKSTIKIYNNEKGVWTDARIQALKGKKLRVVGARRMEIEDNFVYMGDDLEVIGEADKDENGEIQGLFIVDVMVMLDVTSVSTNSTGKTKGTIFQATIKNGTRQDLYTVRVANKIFENLELFIGKQVLIHDLQVKKDFNGKLIENFTENINIEVI